MNLVTALFILLNIRNFRFITMLILNVYPLSFALKTGKKTKSTWASLNMKFFKSYYLFAISFSITYDRFFG